MNISLILSNHVVSRYMLCICQCMCLIYMSLWRRIYRLNVKVSVTCFEEMVIPDCVGKKNCYFESVSVDITQTNQEMVIKPFSSGGSNVNIYKQTCIPGTKLRFFWSLTDTGELGFKVKEESCRPMPLGVILPFAKRCRTSIWLFYFTYFVDSVGNFVLQ